MLHGILLLEPNIVAGFLLLVIPELPVKHLLLQVCADSCFLDFDIKGEFTVSRIYMC